MIEDGASPEADAVALRLSAVGRVEGSQVTIETGADGVATVPNLAPGKYEIYMRTPVGSDWQQTTTYAGGIAIDEAGVTENDQGVGAPRPPFGLLTRQPYDLPFEAGY